MATNFEWFIAHKVNLDSSFEAKTFFNAVKIWLDRPQVVNRRLTGSYVFQTFKIVGNCGEVLKTVFDLVKGSGSILLEELLTRLSKFEESKSRDSSTWEHVDVEIRKLLPRQSDKFKDVTEIVIQDIENKSVIFIPFEDETATRIIPKTENAYKISLDSDQCGNCQSLSLAVLRHGVNGDGITCPTIEWLKSCLLPKLCKWMQEDGSSVKNYGPSLRLIPVDRYTERYEVLKKKYKHFVKMWPERTDPHKFVYEDVAIATYLLLLWENGDNKRKAQTFVDLGCGNGLLVHILANEGHTGKGIDLRSRKVWSLFDEKTNLEIASLDPSSLTFPDVDWLIGNHSDELTPWIPVIAARSSYNCKYFVLPCCFHDFYNKFQRGKSKDSQYRSYLNYVQSIGEKCGFHIQEDVLRIPSTKRICQIGHDRSYPQSQQDNIEHNISAMLQVPLKQKAEPEEACTIQPPHENNSSTEVPDVEQSVVTMTFVPRCEKEPVKNCTQLNKALLESIVERVARELLTMGDNSRKCEHENEKRKSWNKGGSMMLSDVSKLFSQEVLNELRCEAGGIQTVLRNCHQVFRVQHSVVQIRDWQEESDANEEPTKRKRQNSGSTRKYWKTKPCWFHDNHPDGCPLGHQQCSFAHGAEDLKILSDNQRKQ